MAKAETLGTLVPVGGGDAIPLLKDVVTVGRRTGCDVVLNFPDISKLHCELLFSPTNGWQVRDMNSSNGVKVKGVRISGRKTLRPNDEFSIGHHKFTLRYAAPEGMSLDADDDDDFGGSLLEKAGIVKPKPTTRG